METIAAVHVMVPPVMNLHRKEPVGAWRGQILGSNYELYRHKNGHYHVSKGQV